MNPVVSPKAASQKSYRGNVMLLIYKDILIKKEHFNASSLGTTTG